MSDLPTIQDSRYEPIAQKEYCCVPACIQMIMQKHSLDYPTQDELAYHLGVVVPPEMAHLLNPVAVGTGPESGNGTQLLDPKYEFNTVADRLGLGIHMRYIQPAQFSATSLLEYFKSAERTDADVIVCYDFKTRYGIEPLVGHVNLFDRITDNEDPIRFIEPQATPGYEDYLWRHANAATLLGAMQAHDRWMGGVWEITTTNGS